MHRRVPLGKGVIFTWQMNFLSYCNNLILFLTFLDFFLDLGFFSKYTHLTELT